MSHPVNGGPRREGLPEQQELLLEAQPSPLLPPGTRLAGLDLFAGIGGLSAGFADVGFSMTGVDSEPVAGEVYKLAGFGDARTHDLRSELFETDVSVIVGGPPCKPWSPVNLQRRRSAHEDHGLLARFVENVQVILPAIFVMENVPALGSDEVYRCGVEQLRASGYDVAARVLHYDRFGAATKRRRLFTVGVRDVRGGGQIFLRLLREHHAPSRTVRDAIARFRDAPRGSCPDHDWSELQTISKYRERYESGQYGWTRLNYDEPSPSFGSVAKTYILHPEAGVDGYTERVLSVREVLAIMGFPDSVRFPEGTSRTKRYQMVANSVSPQVSRAVAQTARTLLIGRPEGH